MGAAAVPWRPGEGQSPWRAGGAASAALLSSPAEARRVPPGRALSANPGGSQPEPQSIRRGGLGRLLRRSDSEDGAEGLRPARPWAPPGAGGARRAAELGQGTPPAAVAPGADLVWGGGIVPVVDGRPVELVDQPMHRARPEAARLCLESVNALAVALDADASILPVAAGRERRAGMRGAQWGPGGGEGEGRDPLGRGRAGPGGAQLPQQPRPCPRRERGAERAALPGEAPPVYGCDSYASRARVTIYISVSQQRRCYLPPAEERGERKAGGCSRRDAQPGQDLPLGRGGSTARITLNARKRGDPETSHCPQQVPEPRKDCNLPGRRDSGLLLHVLGAYERQHVGGGPQPPERSRGLHVPLGSA